MQSALCFNPLNRNYKTFAVVKRIFDNKSSFIHLFFSDLAFWDCSDRGSFTMPRKISPGWRRYLTVEPVILLYTFGLMTSMPIWDQYVYSTLSEKRGFPYDELVVEKEGLSCNFTELNSTLKDLEQQVRWPVKWYVVHWRNTTRRKVCRQPCATDMLTLGFCYRLVICCSYGNRKLCNLTVNVHLIEHTSMTHLAIASCAFFLEISITSSIGLSSNWT